MTRTAVYSRRTLAIAAAALGLLIAMLLPAAEAQAEPYISCKTPRQATMTFINNLQEETWYPKAATTCFDWSGMEGGEEARVERVRQLLAVLDARGHYVYYDKIPDSADYQNEAGWNRYGLFPGDLPTVNVTREEGRWVFTEETVNSTPRLFEQTFPIGLQRLAHELPPTFHSTFIGVAWWQYLFLTILLVLAVLLGRVVELIVSGVLRRVVRRQEVPGWGDEALKAARWPVTLLVAGGCVLPLLSELALPVRFSLVLHVAVRTVITAAIVMILFRAIDALSEYLEKRSARTDTRLDDQLVPLVRKSLKVVMSVLAAIFILQNLDVDVASLLAGLGLGGLAFALAAKDTLANMFGSLTIFLDRPFQIGDWIKVAGVEGTVEEVGFRSTRVRTFTKALVTVPNSTIAKEIIDNMSKRPMRRMKMTLGLTYDATPEQLQAFCEGVRAILQANPGVFQEYYEVHFYNFGDFALEILVYAFLDVETWTEELINRHNILIECMRLAEEIGVSFAYPTQSLHIESLKSGEPPKAPGEEALRRAVNGFAPGGPLAQPEGRGLTAGYMPNVGNRRGGDDDA